MGLKQNDLFVLLRDYFKSYLPVVRKSSPHTIRTYQVAIEQFLDYIKETHNIKLYEITICMINHDAVVAYLDYLDSVKRCCVTTRNHRLHCVRGFCKYASTFNMEAATCWNTIQLIRCARSEMKPVGYMSMNAINAILAQPDPSTRMGLRDMFLLLFLYQTGARVQELVNVRIKDISFRTVAVVTLKGKGSKVRCIPLRDQFASHLNKYLEIFHPQHEPYSNEYLFFTVRNGNHGRMTEDNVRRLTKKYGELAQKKCPEIPDNVHPHLFRHSRAMHLYQNGVALPLVSEWLGHSRLDTTLIYAHADTEQKRKAIEKAIPEESSLKLFMNSERYSMDDEETIKRLYGLR